MMGARIPPAQLVGESDEHYCARLRAWSRVDGWLLVAVHAAGIGFLLMAIASLLLLAARDANGQEQARPRAIILAASADLRGPYAGKVVLALPYLGGHVGLILNAPGKSTLAEVYPEDVPSQAVHDPVYFGGPEGIQYLNALTGGARPGPRSVEMVPGVWLAIGRSDVDAVIARDGAGARYYVGIVVWQADELTSELRRGFWTVREATPATILRGDPAKLWDQLRSKGVES